MPEPGLHVAIPTTITEYEHLLRPHRWRRVDTEWQTWADALCAAGPGVYLSREDVPLLGLYEVRQGGGRAASDVVCYHGLALDFDNVPFGRVEAVAQRLQEWGVAYLWHTTWSHLLPEKGERRRILIPLDRPLPVSQYRGAMALVKARLAPDLDVKATQRSQAFFVPATTQDRLHEAELFCEAGKALDLACLGPLLSVADATPVEQPTRAIDRGVWERIASKWRAKADPRLIDLGTRMGRVCDGVRFAAEGERDSTLWRLVSAIVKDFPDVSADSVSDLFAQSLGRMAIDDGEDALTDADLREKLERARMAAVEAQTGRWHPERVAAIKQAYGGLRSTPYTAEELQDFQTLLQVDAEQLERCWVVQREQEYYILSPSGEYVHCKREAFANTARVLLSPAPIDLYRVDVKGRRQLTREEILERFSTPVDTVRYSLTTNAPIIDLVNRVFTLPGCRQRDLEPRFDPQIDAWLQLLGGPWYETLLRWLSHVPDLSRPLAALVLTGPKGVGKGLLALGLARIWTTAGPTTLRTAMGHFTGALMTCPFCSADEGAIPRDNQGNERTEDLREFIQATTRQVDRKYRDAVTLDGCTRLLVSANNEDVLALGAGLSANDVAAIAARFFHVAAVAKAAEYLESLGGWEATEAWVAGDGIARHVLWLHRHARAPWDGRFGVDTQQGLINQILVRNGVRSQLCELFLRALRDPTRLTPGAMVIDGSLLITLDWVLASWETFLRRGVRTPTTASVIKALDGLGERIEIDGEGWTIVGREILHAWAKDSGTGTPGTIKEWLEHHEKETV